jgi:hypothetical protein
MVPPSEKIYRHEHPQVVLPPKISPKLPVSDEVIFQGRYLGIYFLEYRFI